MSIDLDTAYARTGLNETPENDALLTTLMDITTSMLEMYLDRKFIMGQETESFYYTHADSIQLIRYPVVSIDIIVGSHHFRAKHKVNAKVGLVLYRGPIFDDEVTITYTGGYDPLPAALEEAYWITFNNALNLYEDGTDVGSGEIQSVTIPDVGTVRYNTSADAAAAMASAPGANAAIPSIAAALLEPYRRYSA